VLVKFRFVENIGNMLKDFGDLEILNLRDLILCFVSLLDLVHEI
jgi:hypothetical protein